MAFITYFTSKENAKQSNHFNCVFVCGLVVKFGKQ